jgi:transketolase
MMSTIELANQIRRESLKMVHRAKASHIASALSIADLLAVLYGQVLKFDPKIPKLFSRDRFILSKGHACVAVYAALAEVGFFDKSFLQSYGDDFSWLMNHISHKVPGVEFSTGSLGHGLPFGAGKALGSKIRGESWKTYVLLSDGEMDEGSNWEALMFAAHRKLNNLIVIIDYNKMQSLDTTINTLDLEPLVDKIHAFGCIAKEVDGHNHNQIFDALMSQDKKRPLVLVAHTTKGKGVDFMENRVEWHYKNPNDQQLNMALDQLGVSNA